MSPTAQQKRAFWLRHLHQWHWVSSALCLIAMLLFAITGFTLNHAADIEAKPIRQTQHAQLPPALRQQLQDRVLHHQESASKTSNSTSTALPLSIQSWLEREYRIEVAGKPVEWSAEEIYIALPRPGGDAWLRLEVASGEMEYEKTERGTIALLNDLHKGRNTGKAWNWFIDFFAFACLVFCVTGLILLKMHADNRRMTWPMVALGLVAPLLIAILFIH